MLYRKEVDGLRALAIVPVIMFHAGVTGFGGGYVGVDVFFVISGYLITSILLAERDEGRFSIIDFYERRARRILPALFFVILSCLPFAWWLMTPYQFYEFAQSLVAVSLFASNFLFWKQSDYFDASSELKPLLHTWSLAVEEQYYLIFPALLWIIWRFGKKRTAAVVGILALISLTTAQIFIESHQAATFYLLHARAWELFMGGLIAIYLSTGRCPSSDKTRHLGTLGIILIAISVTLFDKNTPFPSLYALLPTLGAGLIILFATPSNLSGKLLGSRPLVTIGLVSYSAYLWHQPILAFLRIHNDTLEMTPHDLALVFAILLPVTYFSYQFIEKPFRSRSTTSSRLVFAFSLTGIAVYAGVGMLGYSQNGFVEYKLAQIKANQSSFFVDIQKARADRTALTETFSPILHQESFSGTAGRKVLIVGDSMGDDLALTLSEYKALFPEYEFRLLRLQNMCIQDLDRMNDFCRWEFDKITNSALVEQSDLVVASFLWKDDANFTAIDQFLHRLHERNRNLRVLGSAAFVDMASLSYKIASNGKISTQSEIDTLVFQNRRPKFDKGNLLAEEWARQNQVPYFDRKRLYCSDAEGKCRIIVAGEGSILWDNAHLTKLGMKITAQQLQQVGWLAPDTRSESAPSITQAAGLK